MARRFEGRATVVTGASSGIGAAAARLFAAEGSPVALAARNREKLEALARDIATAGGRAVPIATDVADPNAAAALVERTVRELGGIDILVNNAGANQRGPIEEHSPEELASVVQVNLVAPIVLTRLVLPHMRKRGRGAIVNVASIAGRIPVGREAVYSATKFGLRAFTFALAEELEGSGITVSAVSPGPVETGFILEDLDHVPDVVFAQPMSSAEDIARLIVDSAADGARERVMPWMTGLMATAGYLFPGLGKIVLPLMEPRGKRAKEEFRKRHSAAR